jgi:hypothetical protein
VAREALAEVVQRLRRSRRAGREPVGALADGDMVAEHAKHDRMVHIAVGGVAGQPRLLLEAEVPSAVRGPVCEERFLRLAGVCSPARRSFCATNSAG